MNAMWVWLPPNFHRPGRTGDADLPPPLQRLANAVHIGDRDREMAESRAEIVSGLLIPVVGQLDHRVVGLPRHSPTKASVNRPVGKLAPPQQAHTEMPGVEIERFLKVLHPDHGVEQAVAGSCLRHRSCDCSLFDARVRPAAQDVEYRRGRPGARAFPVRVQRGDRRGRRLDLRAPRPFVPQQQERRFRQGGPRCSSPEETRGIAGRSSTRLTIVA